MSQAFLEELKRLLHTSDAKQRKRWAQQIVIKRIPLSSLMGLLHSQGRTAQRFTWLIGDLLEVDPEVVRHSLPLLFSLRDQMPFPGMQRSVAKCLWYLDVPAELEHEAIPQLFEWLENDKFAVGVKHYASKALYDLAIVGRIEADLLSNLLRGQMKHENKAHAGRIEKLLAMLRKKTSG